MGTEFSQSKDQHQPTKMDEIVERKMKKMGHILVDLKNKK